MGMRPTCCNPVSVSSILAWMPGMLIQYHVPKLESEYVKTFAFKDDGCAV
jgi:hypothetical protein